VAAKQEVVIRAPDIRAVEVRIRGTSPYVQNRFSAKAQEMMREKQEAGSTSKKGSARTPKDFKALYEGAMHKSTEGWHGIPAPAFRNALISACRLAGFAMTRAKLSVFVDADGYDVVDGTPLVKITKGTPKYSELPARNETGVVDIRPRPMWEPGWEATVRIKYDSEQFTLEDVVNLMLRAGQQVGIGEGRHDSPRSCGMGWGCFDIVQEA